MNRSIRLLVGACVLLSFAPAFAQAVYTWKDDKGVTHYSDSPPPAGAKKKNVRTAQDPVSAATPVAAVKPADAADAAAKPDNAADQAAQQAAQQAIADKQAAQRDQACKQAQANLAVLNSQAGVSVDRDGDGKADAVLDDKGRQQEVQAMQSVATANCN
ncbi:DUF4124 domain-containing protein [Lysobacter sp. 2RAF19]